MSVCVCVGGGGGGTRTGGVHYRINELILARGWKMNTKVRHRCIVLNFQVEFCYMDEHYFDLREVGRGEGGEGRGCCVDNKN